MKVGEHNSVGLKQRRMRRLSIKHLRVSSDYDSWTVTSSSQLMSAYSLQEFNQIVRIPRLEVRRD